MFRRSECDNLPDKCSIVRKNREGGWIKLDVSFFYLYSVYFLLCYAEYIVPIPGKSL
ncbi:hypothetical protein [Candidatus Scalindua japonica]|uniref:hypothetical protein n=1 Tax=Candidatus Scalindua japonica TaxID=1284222 RepID=UPI0013A5A147|nr:hypothetical protein [Candidatus Scalindua japonica]